MPRSKLGSCLLLVMLSLTAAGCGNRTGENAQSVRSVPLDGPQCPLPPGSGGITDRAPGFDTIAALAKASEAVVIASATTDATVSYLAADTPETLTRLTVVRTLSGNVQLPVLKLRQLGSLTTCVDPERTIVIPGHQYIVAVLPFSRSEGPTGEYTTTGGPEGLFAFNGVTVRRLDPGSPALPAELSLAEFIQRVAE